MKLPLKAIALVVCSSSYIVTARAADLSVVPYPGYGASTAFSWTGPYLGYNLGAGWNTQRFSSAFAGDWNTTNIGFMGGIQGGYNYQITSFVIGIEGEADAEQRPEGSVAGLDVLEGEQRPGGHSTTPR